MGLIMASIAQLIHEGHQPTVANVGLTYNLLDASGGLHGWAELVTDPVRWNTFSQALSVGGATAETIAQIQVYLMDWLLNGEHGIAAFPAAWNNPW
jgi:hypothetical protein